MIEEGEPLLPSVVAEMANPSWEAASARILVVRLSRWKDIEQSQAHLVLFDEARKALPSAYIDFAFLPPKNARRALDARRASWFSGRASGRSPSDFDLVMVSNSFALELVNLPYLFTSSGLPLEARSRSELPEAPIVVLGGSNASAAGALVVEAEEPERPALESLVDGIFFGEGEGAAGPLARILAEGFRGGEAGTGRPEPEERRRRLLAGAAIPGFWPCLLGPGQGKAKASGRPRSLLSPLVLNGGAASTARLAISSGCPGYCSFCLEGWDRSPYAEADLERLLREAKALRRSTGASELEFHSFNFNTHARIPELLFELNKVFRRVSLMSQRLDVLADTVGLMQIELAAGKRSFTLGVEGISRGMRAYFRKGLSDGQLWRCLELCLGAKAREVKLFYMISGLETEDDLAEFADFATKLGELRRRLSPSTKVLASAGFLVRLPCTPLQFAPLEFDSAKLERIGLRLKVACSAQGLEFRLASEVGEAFVDQALSLLGRWARPWLLKVPEAGFVYESALPAGAWRSLRPLVLGAPPEALGEKGPEFRPPLPFVEPETRHRVLRRHYEEARLRRDRESCLGRSCSGCGACADAAEVSAMTGHLISIPSPELLVRRLSSLAAAKDRFSSLWVAVRLPESLAGAEPEYRCSWLQRELFVRFPGLEGLVLEARECLFVREGTFGTLFPAGTAWFGWEAFELFGPSAAALGKRLSEEADPGLLRPLPSKAEPRRVRIALALRGIGPTELRPLLSAYLASKGLAFTERREGKQSWILDLAPGSRGRRQVTQARIEGEGDGARLVLEVGGRAELEELFSGLARGSLARPLAEVLSWEGLSV